MWDLICRETYDPTFFGLPFDSSGYRNHGQPNHVDTLADGMTARSGSTRFVHPDSTIAVARTSEWASLLALRIDCTLRLNGPSPLLRVIAEGVSSFQFHVQPDGEVEGAVVLPAGSIQSVSSTGAGQSGYRAPLDRWIKLSFIHDGATKMALLANGALVAQRQDAQSSVVGVGPEGLRIGGGQLHGNPLHGDIDEISIWRFHPDSIWHDFTNRPIDSDTAKCWEHFLERLNEVFTQYPDCALRFGQVISAGLDTALATIRANGPAAVAHAGNTYRRYFELWQTGRLDTPEMAQLITDWFAWLTAQGISLQSDPQLMDFFRSPCFQHILEACRGFDCDDQFLQYLKMGRSHVPAPTI
jgi:hypothetical protein